MRAEVVDLEDRLTVRDAVARLIVKDSCATPDPSLRRIVEAFRASLDKSLSETFPIVSIDYQIHIDTAVNSITLRFLEFAGSDDVEGSIKGEDNFNRLTDSQLIKL